LTNDINVSIVAAILVFVFSYLTKKYENFEPTDYVNLLVNELNYDLDRVVQKPFTGPHNLKFQKPQNVPNTPSKLPGMPKIENISHAQFSDAPSQAPKDYTYPHSHKVKEYEVDQFQFTPDNLRYLHYNPNKLVKYQQGVYEDKLYYENQVNPDLE